MKKILIIGASSGIGKALALSYAQAGHTVGITGRRVELLAEAHDAFPQNIRYAQQDVTGNKNEEIIGDIINKMGGMNILIISAGVGFDNPDFNWEPEKLTIDVNVMGFAEIVNIGYAYFSKQKSGHIVGISSIAGIRGIDSYPAYSASKAFVSNYLEAIRKKAKRQRRAIMITDIVPGFVDTPMTQGNDMFWVAPVEKAADQIMKAIDKKVCLAYITKRWRLIAYVLKFMPRMLYDKI